MLVITQIILLFSALSSFSRETLAMEFTELFGTITIRTGDVQHIKCEEDDSSAGNSYFWSIGDSNYTAEVEQPADNVVTMSLNLMAIIEDDGKYLSCCKDTECDQVRLSVFKQELVSASMYSETLPSTITAEVSIYPEPTPELATWKIESEDGGALNLHPGLKEINQDIVAQEIQPLGDHNYKFVLDVKHLDNFEKRNISLTIVTKNMPLTVFFQPESPELKAVGLSLPWWMWIIVVATGVVFIVIFVIIYFVVRKPKRGKTQRHNGNLYTQASQH